MKKLIFTAAIVIAILGMANNAQAQATVNAGIKLNGNLTNVKLSDLEGSKSKFNAGASLGGFAKIEFSEHFALQPELLFNYTESKIKYDGDNLRFKYAGIEVPVYALGQIKAGNGRLFAGIGPHIGYGFSIDSATERIPEGTPGENKIELEHWYMGGGVMAGYEFRNGISINAGYKMGWDLSSRHKSSNVKTQVVSLGVAYKF